MADKKRQTRTTRDTGRTRKRQPALDLDAARRLLDARAEDVAQAISRLPPAPPRPAPPPVSRPTTRRTPRGLASPDPATRAAAQRKAQATKRQRGTPPRGGINDWTPEQRMAGARKIVETRRRRGTTRGGINDWTPEQRKEGRQRAADTYSDRAGVRRFGRLFADAINALDTGIDPLRERRERERDHKRARDKRHREKHSAERAEYNRQRRKRIKEKRAKGTIHLPKQPYPFFRWAPWQMQSGEGARKGQRGKGEKG